MTAGMASFLLFGPAHLCALATVGLIAAALCVTLRHATASPDGAGRSRFICGALAVVLIASVGADQVVLAARGEWSVQHSLPLHLCDIAVILCAVALVELARRPQQVTVGQSPRAYLQTVYELTYFWGLGGTTQALLTPDIEEGFPSFVWVQFFAAHGGIVVSILAMTIGLRMRPRPGSAARTWLVTAALAPPVMLIDWLLGANYMFLCGPPEQPTLYDYLGPWPWTLLSLAGLGAVLMWLCYLPFWVLDRRRRR